MIRPYFFIAANEFAGMIRPYSPSDFTSHFRLHTSDFISVIITIDSPVPEEHIYVTHPRWCPTHQPTYQLR